MKKIINPICINVKDKYFVIMRSSSLFHKYTKLYTSSTRDGEYIENTWSEDISFRIVIKKTK